MGDQKCLWPRSVTSIALWEGCCPKVCPSGRAYVVICGSGGLRSRGPYLNIAQILGSSDFWILIATSERKAIKIGLRPEINFSLNNRNSLHWWKLFLQWKQTRMSRYHIKPCICICNWSSCLNAKCMGEKGHSLALQDPFGRTSLIP